MCWFRHRPVGPSGQPPPRAPSSSTIRRPRLHPNSSRVIPVVNRSIPPPPNPRARVSLPQLAQQPPTRPQAGLLCAVSEAELARVMDGARARDSVEIHNHPRIPRSARPSSPPHGSRQRKSESRFCRHGRTPCGLLQSWPAGYINTATFLLWVMAQLEDSLSARRHSENRQRGERERRKSPPPL